LLLTAGLPWPTILYTILLDEVMVVTGLVGALVATSYKWGYFVFATVALFGIAYNVVYVGLQHATAISSTVKRTFLICGVWTIFLWFIYPIAWGLSEGGNIIAPDSEAVFYGILDVLAKPVFGALLLFGHRSIDPADLGLHIRDYQQPNNPVQDQRQRDAADAEKDGENVNNGNNGGVLGSNAGANGSANSDGISPAGNAGVIGTHANHSSVGQTV